MKHLQKATFLVVATLMGTGLFAQESKEKVIEEASKKATTEAGQEDKKALRMKKKTKLVEEFILSGEAPTSGEQASAAEPVERAEMDNASADDKVKDKRNAEEAMKRNAGNKDQLETKKDPQGKTVVVKDVIKKKSKVSKLGAVKKGKLKKGLSKKKNKSHISKAGVNKSKAK